MVTKSRLLQQERILFMLNRLDIIMLSILMAQNTEFMEQL